MSRTRRSSRRRSIDLFLLHSVFLFTFSVRLDAPNAKRKHGRFYLMDLLFLVGFVLLEEFGCIIGRAGRDLDMDGHASDAFKAALVFVFQKAANALSLQKILDD